MHGMSRMTPLWSGMFWDSDRLKSESKEIVSVLDTQEKEINMDKFKKEDVQYFLNMDLAELSEDTPLSEGDGVAEFQEEAEAVAAALKGSGVPAGKVPAGRARSLFLMRAFYFLGVFRGGEAARATILDDEAENGDFQLSDVCTELFAGDLAALPSAELTRLCGIMGL